MRLLWHSNAPFITSGYGNQTGLFAPRLNALGHPTAVSAFVGLQNAVMEWQGVRIYPQVYEQWGQNMITAHAAHWAADALVSLCDVLVMNPDRFVGLPWLPWTPIDAETIRPEEVPLLRRAYKPIAMSRYGERVMRDAGLSVGYAPHGVDTSVFCPGDSRAARESLEMPTDRFVVGMVAANLGRPSRKAFPEQIVAFAEFKRKHPDAFLYLHTVLGRQMTGIDLLGLLDSLGLTSGRDWATCPTYEYLTSMMDGAQLSKLYRSMDVLLSASWGEGFGIPILEAQSSGTPVIVGDWTAMSELCFAGWKIAKEDARKVWNNFDAWMWSAEPGAIVDALEDAYEASGRQSVRDWARDGALAYDADLVADLYWRPLLSEVSESLGLDTPIQTSGRTNVVETVRAEIRGGLYDNLDLKAGDIVLDLGAHVGVVSIYLAKKYPGIRVIAFEPNPESYKYLVQNVKAAAVNVEPYPFAVSGDGRDLTLYCNPDINEGGTSAFTQGAESFTVPSKTLADILAWLDVERVALLKIDVEGAEHEVLWRNPALLNLVDRIAGEFHENDLLRGQGNTIEGLLEMVGRYLPPERVRVHCGEIAEAKGLTREAVTA